MASIAVQHNREVLKDNARNSHGGGARDDTPFAVRIAGWLTAEVEY
jgi:hypothetical protein